MKRLLKNGTVVNVFTGELIKTNVLFENGIILGVDDYGDDEADEVIDAAGKYMPGLYRRAYTYRKHNAHLPGICQNGGFSRYDRGNSRSA